MIWSKDDKYEYYTESFFTSSIKSLLKGNKKVALWGYGEIGDSMCRKGKLKSKISIIVDIDEKKHGLKPLNNGIVINPPEHLIDNEVDVILIATNVYTGDIIRFIKQNIKYEVIVVTNNKSYCITNESPAG